MVDMSFIDLASRSDLFAPPTGRRGLDRRHRWVNPAPPRVISMRMIGDRHLGTASTASRFLSYNTYLIPGLTLPDDLRDFLLRAGITADRAIRDLGLSVAEVLAHLGRDAMEVIQNKFNPVSLAQALGVNMGGLEDFVSDALGLVDTLTFQVFDLAEHLTFDLVLKFWGGSALDALQSIGLDAVDVIDALLLDQVKILEVLALKIGKLVLGELGIDFPFPFSIKDAPARPERALAIGQMCAAQGYDIMAFSEVWDQDQDPSVRIPLMDGLAASPLPLNTPVEGPRNNDQMLDSGLYRVTTGPREILDLRRHEFFNRGHPLADSDAWATKGILLTRINLGVGVIDLYSTHLIAGGDLVFGGDEARKNALRLTQLEEVVQFITETHMPGNVAILCGDTNIDAEFGTPGPAPGQTTFSPTSTYGTMVAMLGAIGMDDLFMQQEAFSPAIADHRWSTHGPEDEVFVRFNNRCVIIRTGGANDGFCDDMVNGAATATARMDYVFVERPTMAHTFELDFSRMRRAPFERPNLVGGQLYMSDHIGQDITLIASPMTH